MRSCEANRSRVADVMMLPLEIDVSPMMRDDDTIGSEKLEAATRGMLDSAAPVLADSAAFTTDVATYTIGVALSDWRRP